MTLHPPDSWDTQFRPQAPNDAGQPEPGPDPTPAWLILLLCSCLILAGIGYVTFGLSSGDDGVQTRVAGTVEVPASSSDSEDTTEQDDTVTTTTPLVSATAGSDTTVTIATTTAPPTTVAPAVEDASADPESVTIRVPSRESLIAGIANPDTRTAVFSGGIVYLRGQVPSQDVADVIFSRAAAVLGPENVVVEYEIDPSAPVPDSAPLYVDDKVLFEVGSAKINPGFTPLLDLGTLLMQQTPTVRIAVLAHTDSIGTAEFNQALSEQRAGAVKAYWVDAGIDPTRVEAIGLGETLPQADNLNAAGRSANRRAEFIVHGILG